MISVFSDEQIRNSLAEVASANDRAAAILLHSLTEAALVQALSQRLRPDAKVSELFPTYESRVETAYSLGILTKIVRDDLRKIGAIRNKFAHRLDVDNFDHKDIKGLCHQINAVFLLKNPQMSTREKFIEACSMATFELCFLCSPAEDERRRNE